jgi:hypothetical protein
MVTGRQHQGDRGDRDAQHRDRSASCGTDDEGLPVPEVFGLPSGAELLRQRAGAACAGTAADLEKEAHGQHDQAARSQPASGRLASTVPRGG